MKKLYITLLIALCATLQVAAQTDITATKSGFVYLGTTTFNEAGLQVRGNSSYTSYVRIGYVEVAVGSEEVLSAEFNLAIQKTSTTSLEYPVEFATKGGAIPSDIEYDNQPDGFTEVATTSFSGTLTDAWITADVTASYNEAVAAGETAMMIRLTSNQNSGLIYFYHVNTGTAYKPYITLTTENPCEPEYSTTNCIMTEGEEIVVGETTITESGSYIITGTTECGAEKIDTVNVLFITEGVVETDYTICAGDELPIQIGATEYQIYTEAGTYTDVITSTDGNTSQITITNLIVSEEPTVNELSDALFVEGGSTTFDAGEGAATYQWYLNGTAIAGATEQTLTITDETPAILVGENTLYVEVANEYGCEGSSNKVTVSYLTTTPQSSELLVARSGFVQVGTTGFNESGLQVRGSSSYTSYVRIAYVEVAVGTVEASEVLLNLCFTKASSTAIDYPLQFATMNGAIPSDIDYTNQPDGFVDTELTSISGSLVDSWISTDITTSYNAAVAARETAMMVRMISDQNSGVLYFYHPGSGTNPYINVTTPAMVSPIETNVLADATISEGTSTTLDAGEGFASYQWYLNDAALEGATEQTVTISIETAGIKEGSNTVYVVVSNEYGMTATSNTATITSDTTTGIAEATTQVEVKLAPIPVKDRLYIDSNKAFDSVAIYDVVGKLVLSASVVDNSIDMSGLSTGVYMVSLSNNTETVTKMVTKK